MPVYNEAESIAQVVNEWAPELDRLQIEYEWLVLDDGSRDHTADVLADLGRQHPALRVFRHDNVGHGPTILRGYRMTRGEWVFQVDSDGELSPSAFRELWDRRDDYDFLVGRRIGRSAPVLRRWLTWASTMTVRILFGRGISDVNVPYRLMRGSRLREMAAVLADDLFAPNVILAGLAVRQRLRVCEVPVPHAPRPRGVSSLGGVKALRAAARSLRQTVATASQLRRRERSRRRSRSA